MNGSDAAIENKIRDNEPIECDLVIDMLIYNEMDNDYSMGHPFYGTANFGNLFDRIIDIKQTKNGMLCGSPLFDYFTIPDLEKACILSVAMRQNVIIYIQLHLEDLKNENYKDINISNDDRKRSIDFLSYMNNEAPSDPSDIIITGAVISEPTECYIINDINDEALETTIDGDNIIALNIDIDLTNDDGQSIDVAEDQTVTQFPLTLNEYISKLQTIPKPKNKTEFILIIKTDFQDCIKWTGTKKGVKIRCILCSKYHSIACWKNSNRMAPIFDPNKSGPKWKLAKIWPHFTNLHIKVLKDVYTKQIKRSRMLFNEMVKEEQDAAKQSNPIMIEEEMKEVSIPLDECDDICIQNINSNAVYHGIFGMVSISNQDKWIIIVNDEKSAESYLNNININKLAVQYIFENENEWAINPKLKQIRCLDCYVVFNDDDKLALLKSVCSKERSVANVWCEGRSLITLKKQDLVRHKQTEQCKQCKHIQQYGCPDAILIPSTVKSPSSALENRFGTIFWMLYNGIAPHKLREIYKLLYYHKAENIGLSGLSDGTAIKMTNTAGIYILAVVMTYIDENVRCLAVGLDCASTSDQIKFGHWHLRFVMRESADPLTLHIGSRKVTGHCTGEKLYLLTKQIIEFNDYEDVDFIGFSIGKQYKYIINGKEEIREFANVIKRMRESGLNVSMTWNKFIKITFHTISDGGGDVYGCNIGWAARIRDEKKREYGIETTRVRCVCHIIDVFAQNSLEELLLFFMLFDLVKNLRSFNNRSPFRKGLYYDVCIKVVGNCMSLPIDFEDRWMIAAMSATKAWKNNYKGTMCYLEQHKDEIIEQCKKAESKQRIKRDINELTANVVSLKSHMRSYAADELMTLLALKWQVMSESQDLNVITYILYVESIETALNARENNQKLSWILQFKSDNIVANGNRLRWIKYSKTIDGVEYDFFVEISKQRYGKIRNEVYEEYQEAVTDFKNDIIEHKESDQYKMFEQYRYVLDYTQWNLETKKVNEIIEYLNNRNKEPLNKLFDSLHKALLLIGLPENTTKEIFIVEIVSAQISCVRYIHSLCTENMRLIDVVKKREFTFYDIWRATYCGLNEDNSFAVVWEYGLAIDIGNIFAEQTGHQTNLVRNILQRRSTPNLTNNKLFGKMDTPKNIITPEHEGHVKTISWIWRNVVRGHDVEKPNSLEQKPNFDIILPKPNKKSYQTKKAQIKKQNMLSSLWSAVKMNVFKLNKTPFKKRGNNE